MRLELAYPLSKKKKPVSAQVILIMFSVTQRLTLRNSLQRVIGYKFSQLLPRLLALLRCSKASSECTEALSVWLTERKVYVNIIIWNKPHTCKTCWQWVACSHPAPYNSTAPVGGGEEAEWNKLGLYQDSNSLLGFK